jgi:hypothetical protein
VSVLKELRNLMKNVPSSALLLFLAVSPVASQDEARSVPGLRASERSAVYAKVLLPVKAPAEGDHPAVESWIARKLRKQGATEFRAVTGWVRLAEKGEGSTRIWDATLDGELYGCPVRGQVSERSVDDRVQVTFSGWAPFPPSIKGNSLPAEIGSRTIAVVDTGRVDGVKSYVALLIAPALQTKSGEQDGAEQPATRPESRSEGSDKPQPESEGRSR